MCRCCPDRVACYLPAKAGSIRPLMRFLLLSGVLAAVLAGPARAATYDAIAIDDDVGGARGNGDYAVGQGSTAKQARRIAISNCRAGGNVACTLKLTYRRCGAYASSGRTFGTGIGGSMDQATAAALASCDEEACRLVVADCVGSPLRPPR